jgi:hypothetical protein
LFQSCLFDLIIFQAFRYAPLENLFISPRDLSFITVFGFLAGQEVKDAGVGNLGLRDRGYFYRKAEHEVSIHHFSEHLALEWIQKYIRVFGGDPTKVMMYAPGAVVFLMYFADILFCFP